MKKIVLTLLCGGILCAGTVEDGVIALQKGDRDGAIAHFLFAAERGDVIAQENLGVMYHEGLGVKKDREKAAYWFNVAQARQQQLNGQYQTTSYYPCGCQE